MVFVLSSQGPWVSLWSLSYPSGVGLWSASLPHGVVDWSMVCVFFTGGDYGLVCGV